MLPIKESIVILITICAGLDVTAQTFSTLRSFGVLTNITGFSPQSRLVLGTDGLLYGTASSAEGTVGGTIFRVKTNGTAFTVLKWFTNSLQGTYPNAGLTQSGSVLFGTTYSGGSSNCGTVFKVNMDGSAYTVLKHFAGSDGANPCALLALSGAVLYGTTCYGGSSNRGTVFKMNTDGSAYLVLKHFAGGDGANPSAGLTLSGDVLYGTTRRGGNAGNGTVFKMNTDGTGHTRLKDFQEFDGNEGAEPLAGLTLLEGVLYGTTCSGGSWGYGTVFKLSTNGTGYTLLKDFDRSDGANPYAGLTLSGTSMLYGATSSGGGSGYGSVFRVSTAGSGFTVIRDFSSGDGPPRADLLLAGGVFYGTTYSGGSSGYGTVFRMLTDGSNYEALKNFARSSDGAYPSASLALSGGVLYGTTPAGGSADYGTVFKVNTNGTGYAVLRNFAGSDGATPQASLALSEGVLYGTTAEGGSSWVGTIFKVNTDGSGYTVLKEFDGNEGAGPLAGLTLSGSMLYGTTSSGGTSGNGTVFKLSTNGTGFAVLKHFSYSDGANPCAGLTLSDGVLYGTASSGGTWGDGTVFKLNADGSAFQVLKHFNEYVIGGYRPCAALVLAGGVLYGTTYNGSTGGRGAVFKLNQDGTGFAVLKDFDFGGGVGGHPFAGLTLSGNVLYGTTSTDGSSGCGTLFKLNTSGTGFAVLKHFSSTDGARPQASLTLSESVLYGTTQYGGSFNEGIVYRVAVGLSFNACIITNGLFGCKLSGLSGSTVVIQASTNLQTWIPLQTNVLGSAPLDFSDPQPAASPQRFYRAWLVPE